MHRMLMLLRRSPEQERILDGLLSEQQNPGSPLFHNWLSPQEFGQQFGPASEDVQSVTNWLISHGFTEIHLSEGHTVIEFSGDAGQVQSAFHTAIHQYEVGGALHFANQTDPSIPTALAPVITGIVSLNDFGRRSMAIRGPALRSVKGQRPGVAPDVHPEFTAPEPGNNSTFYGLGPYDFATIYDLLPLWNAGLDGTGQTIAIVGESNISLADTSSFRAFFGLPSNNPTVLIAGPDPGIQPDEIESDLDVQWSGAIAKGAKIELVSSASTEATAGIDLSALYIIDNNLAPVMSESYGECEMFLGTTGNAFESALWQQAAAQGITVLISSGDQGSTACDPTNSNQDVAVHPMAVNGLASSPYAVGVGGTDFNQYNNWSKYWNQTNDPTTKESALGYIPEIPWNFSCGSTTLDAVLGDNLSTACNSGISGVENLNTIATGGGPSSCISSDGTDASTCTGGWPKPIWQTGPGVPSDSARDVPDVSLFAGNGLWGSAYVVCAVDLSGGSGCDPSASSQTLIGVGGTSGSAPAMAGVMAIINQKYGRQGNANYTLYRLASSAKGSSIFHDITSDGNRVACTSRSSDCVIPAGAAEPIGTTQGHDSTAGYDTVTGLGSIDIANLVNNWSSIAYAPTRTSLNLNGGTSSVTAAHGTGINAAVSVNATSGTPSGAVSLQGTAANGSFYLGSLQSGSVSGVVSSLPGGSYSVSAHYAGDAEYAPSDSASVSVNISPEPSTTKVSFFSYNGATGVFVPVASTVPYGSLLVLRVDVQGQSGFGYATGSVSFNDGTKSLGQLNLNSQGTAEAIPTNLLLAGSHTVKATYPGDPSFNGSSGTNGLTVNPASMACTLQSNTTYLRPGWVLVLNADAITAQPQAVSKVGTMVAPTGTISLYSGSTPIAGPTVVTGIGSGIGSLGAFQLPTASIPQVTLRSAQLTSPTAPITAVYSGDGNYASCTSAPLQLTYQTGPVASQVGFTLSAYQNIPVGTSLTMMAGIIAATLPPQYEPTYPTPTGTVQVMIDGKSAETPAQVVPGISSGGELTGAATLSLPTAGLSPGIHAITLSYSGDANYLLSTSNLVNIWLISPDFSLTVTPAVMTLTNGQSSLPIQVQVAYTSGFSGTISFSCSGLPPESTCSFSPSTVTASGTTNLTITTVKAESVRVHRLARNSKKRFRWLDGAGWLSWALVLVVAPRRKRKAFLLWLGSSGVLLFSITSCGGGGGDIQKQVTQTPTATTLSATTTTPAKGTNDTFAASVSSTGSSAPVTGSIQFNVDGAPFESPVKLANATAQIQTSFATAGTHDVSAVYSGDSGHTPSRSAELELHIPYTSGSIPGVYDVSIIASSGALNHSADLTLSLQ
jgi:hypothetical protein